MLLVLCMLAVTCRMPGEAKQAFASPVSMMGQEVSDIRVGKTSVNWFTLGWREEDRSPPPWLSPNQLCERKEPPPVAVQGSAFCNSNQDTLYQLCPEPCGSKFRHHRQRQTSYFCTSCPICQLLHHSLISAYSQKLSLLLSKNVLHRSVSFKIDFFVFYFLFVLLTPRNLFTSNCARPLLLLFLFITSSLIAI